jgi:micrococcal nuclease
MWIKIVIIVSSIFFLICLSSYLDIPKKISELAVNSNWSIDIFYQKDTSKMVRKSGTILRVIDGDTAELTTGERIRYLNIDTPESVKPDTPLMCYGKEAYRFNQSLTEGKEVVFLFDRQEVDKYNRLLPFVFLKDSDTKFIENSVNAQLVINGFARSYIIKPNTTFEREFVNFQQTAQEKKLGLWSECNNPFKE